MCCIEQLRKVKYDDFFESDKYLNYQNESCRI